MLQSGHWEGGPCTSATMAHASVSWACGRHPSTFNQYIEYGPVAVVANDGDTNNEGRSATDNDDEIGDDDSDVTVQDAVDRPITA